MHGLRMVGDRSIRQISQIQKKLPSDVLFTKIFTVKLVRFTCHVCLDCKSLCDLFNLCHSRYS